MRQRHLVLLGWLVLVCMGAAPSRTQTYVSGQVISPSAVTENEDNIYSYLQGGVDTYKTGSLSSTAITDGTIVNADISSSAAIDGSKLSGPINTATALAANGSNCSAGSYPLGVDASGTAESCTAVTGLQTTNIAFTRTAAAGSGAVSITGVGFQPTAVYAMCTDNSAGTRGSIGWSDDARGANQLINIASSWSDSGGQFLDVENGVDNMSVGSITSYDADGWTMTWTKANSGLNVDCQAIAFR